MSTRVRVRQRISLSTYNNHSLIVSMAILWEKNETKEHGRIYFSDDSLYVELL